MYYYHIFKSIAFFLSAGFGGKLGHIKSFRRQYNVVLNDDVSFVDDYFDVQYGRLTHPIYVTSDGPICYTCNKVGHTKRTCESNNIINET